MRPPAVSLTDKSISAVINKFAVFSRAFGHYNLPNRAAAHARTNGRLVLMSNPSRRLLLTARWAGLFAPLFVVGFAGGFTLRSSLVSAQATQVRVTELQCSGDPETVAITNQGINAQDLTGWSLKSDPVTTESFDLTPVGVLAAGVTVFVESGPSASGTFVWPGGFIFRDGDPTDFVRIVDNTGATVHEVNCQGTSPSASAGATVAPTSAPTAAPTSAPAPPLTPAPTPAPANLVPLGGGPPAPSSQTLLVLMVAAGFLAIGAGVITVLTTSPADAGASVSGLGSRVPRWTAPGRRAADGRYLYLLLVGVLALAAQLLGSRRRH